MRAPFAIGPTRVIKSVQFRGNVVIGTSDLEAIALPYLGHPVTDGDIEDLRIKLTHRYVDAGYINSGALVAPTPESPDTLVFQIVEGRLEGIHVSGTGTLDPGYVVRRLTPAEPVLNVDALRERFQLLLSDPLIDQMNARLVPGSGPGQAILDVDVTRAPPYSLTTYFNNYRPPSIGSEGFGLIGVAHNLTGAGDALTVNEETPIQGGSALSTSLHWQMPVYWPGTSAIVQYDRGASAVTEEPLSILGIRSTLESETLGFSQELYQSLRQDLAVSLVHVWRSNRTTLLGQGFSFEPGAPPDTTAPLWRLAADYSYRTEQDVFALRSTVSHVHTNLEDVNALPEPIVPTSSYTVWLLQTQYAHQFGDAGQLVVRATAQETHSHMLPLDAIAIGGDSTVRGFPENQLLADEGQIYSVEYDAPVYSAPARAQSVTVGPFYDLGRGHDIGGQNVTLSAAGAALSAHWAGLELDVSKAWRLAYPHTLSEGSGSLQAHGVYFQLRYTVSFR